MTSMHAQAVSRNLKSPPCPTIARTGGSGYIDRRRICLEIRISKTYLESALGQNRLMPAIKWLILGVGRAQCSGVLFQLGN